MFISKLRCFIVHFLILSSYVLADIPLTEKIGQMIMVGFADDTEWEDTLHFDIEHRNLGGVLLFAHNLDNPDQIRNLTNELKSLATTNLLIATDQEGGFVARLDENNGFRVTKTAYQLGTIENDEDSTRQEASMMADWLADVGINTNLAPVVDVNVNPESPAIGHWDRSYSSDPYLVSNHAAWFIDEFRRKNLVCSLKHFPGHGSAEDDSHLGFTDITQSWSEAELIPYKELIKNGYQDIIMAGHLFNGQLDSIYPASLSEVILTQVLRDSLGFQGVVISDEMFMRAISNNYSFEEAVELAINAGTDILLYSKNDYNDRSLIAEVVDIVTTAIDEGRISETRIDESYQRIITLKNRLSSIAGKPSQVIPDKISLSAYPNPFNISTTIEVKLARPATVLMNVIDLAGRSVDSRRYANLAAGTHQIHFQGDHLATGIYIVTMSTSNQTVSRKIALVK